MARTKGMSLSAEEREDIRREEMLKKAKGYKLKLLDDIAIRDEALAALNQEPESDRKLIRRNLWNLLVEDLRRKEEVLKYTEVMELLAPHKAPILKEFRAAFRSEMKDSLSDKKKIVHKERKRLSALGISGSAVVPKIGTKAEEDDFVSVIEEFREKLADSAVA